MKKLWIFFACLVFFSLASANVEAQESYYGDKVWTITFNMDVDPKTVNKDNIFVKNASGQTLNNVHVTLNPDTKQVYVDALDDYLPGEYTLHISNQVKSTSGNYLKTATKKTFTIKSYEPISILKESQLNDAQKELLRNLEMHWWSQELDLENRKNSRGAYYLGEDLYVVTTGIKSSGGYKIGINKIEKDGDQTIVDLKDIGLPPGMVGTAILDFPFIIIKSTVPPNSTLSFFIDGESVPIKDTSLSKPSIYQTDQSLTITFNTELDPTTVNKDNIFIKNVSRHTVDNVQLTLDKTNTTIYVDTLDDYLPGKYTLHISDQVKSKRGSHLITPITKSFTIKSYGPITILEELELDNALLNNWRVYFNEENNNWTTWEEAIKNSKGAYYLGEDLYIITTGLKPNGGYNIMIDNIETNLDRTSVYFKDIEPEPGTPVPDVIDSPFIIIKSAVPPNATLSFFIDGESVPIKNVPISNP